jgi:integrase/recombinase XerD
MVSVVGVRIGKGKPAVAYIPYRRHKQDCEHKGDKFYRRCQCPMWIEQNGDGTQKRWSLRDSSWAAAEREIDRLKKVDEAAKYGGTSPVAAKTVKEAAEAFLLAKGNEDLAEDTIYRCEQAMKLLVDFCEREGVFYVKDLTLDHLHKFQSQWKPKLKSAQAIRVRMDKIRNFFRYALDSGWISSSPAIPSRWKNPKIKNSDINVRALTATEYDRIIAAVDKTEITPTNKARVKALMQLQRWSGLSLVDAVCLSKDELRREGSGKDTSFRVVLERQKTDTHINNIIPTWLGEELLTVKNGNPEFVFYNGLASPQDAPKYFQKLYKRVFTAAGVDGSSHDLRHTYAINLLTSGVDIRTVSRLLGHKSINVTEKYYSKWCSSQQDRLDETVWAALSEAQ